MSRRAAKICCAAVTTALLLAVAGCEQLTTDYGSTQGRDSIQSIAGFGLMRQYFHNREWEDRTVIRLSERQRSLNTIVYIPTVPQSLGQPAVDWFDDWLKTQNKTLIYILRDYQTEDTYWRMASPLAPPEERLEYRRLSARAHLAKQRSRFAAPGVLSEGWFTYVRDSNPTSFRGWMDLSRLENPRERTVIPFQMVHDLEWQLRAYSAATDGQNTGTAIIAGPWGFQSPGTSQSRTQVEPWMTTENGQPIVLRVTSNDWPNSQILVVAGGSLLTNLGLVDPGSQKLLAAIEQWTFPNPDEEVRKIGFITAKETGVPVTSLSDAAVNTTGMEAFTTWPLNIVSLHLAAVGIIICLVLFPVLGRPRRLARPSKSDFADHLDAVAGLLAKTEGEEFARVRISEYMVRVKGETSGPWVIPPPPPPIIPGPAQTDVHSTEPTTEAQEGSQTGDSEPLGSPLSPQP